MPTPPHCSSAIHICSLAALNDIVEQSSASHVVSVINPWSLPDTPASIAPEHHLKIAINDIEQTQPGLVAPETGHIEQLIEFTQNWDRKRPMVIHCLAGISRSTAAAFISLCTINSGAAEFVVANTIRSASQSASPNRLMVRLADQAMQRDGRMIEAIESIGVGQAILNGRPFSVPSSIT